MHEFPSQLDICFSEICNLDCDYCFVNKTSAEILDFKTVASAVDTFFALGGKSKTITFTTSEPFMHPQLFKRSVEYIFKEADRVGIDVRLVATTNGVLFNRKMREFAASLDERFTLNFSLDGRAESHDAHRKVSGNKGESSFALALANLNAYPKKSAVRVITTVTQTEAGILWENIDYIFSQGFRNIDIFPRMFTFWSEEQRAVLQLQLVRIVEDFNQERWKDCDLRLLNRLWGDTYYAKTLLGSDGNFYLFECMLALAYPDRKRYMVGNAQKLNVAKRTALIDFLFAKLEQKSKNKCGTCQRGSFCASPLPLYLWAVHNKKDFNLYFENFCQLATIMVDLSGKIAKKNKLDKERWGNSQRKNI